MKSAAMTKEVEEVSFVINTYLDNPNGQVENLRQALERLKEFKMSLQILKETQIGRTLSRLNKCVENQSLNDTIANLLVSWKILAKKQIFIDSENTASQVTKNFDSANNKTHVATSAKKRTKIDQLQIELEEKKPKINQSQSELDNKNSVAKPELPAEPRRAGIVKKLAEKFSMDNESLERVGKTAFQVAVDVEKAVYSSIKNFEHYFEQCQALRFNLGVNSKLRSDIILGKISLNSLATITNEEMASDETKKSLQALIVENEAKHLTEKLTPNCHTEPCPKCRSRKVYNRSAQTRSADEPMTQFYTCLSCEKKWKT